MVGYRTLIANILVIAAAALGAVPADWEPYALPALAVVNIALRFLTTTAVGMRA